MSTRSQLTFPLTILVTLAVALLPAQWRLGWSRDVAEIVRFPLQPFTHAAGAFAGWVRPSRSPVEGLSAAERDLVQLVEDRDRHRQLYRAEQQRVLQLEEQLRQIQQIPVDIRRVASASVVASITSRSPNAPFGPVKLKLQRGATDVVGHGTVAVYAGVHLLGRTDGESTRTGCTLLPVTNAAIRLVGGRIFPTDRPGIRVEDAILVQLEPTGNGTFVGDVDTAAQVERGDLVRLSDDRWPQTAQMMVLGEVESVAVKDAEPLRNVVTVRPVYQVQQVSSVTLIVEREATALEEADIP